MSAEQDRELLEMAAKAAGLPPEGMEYGGCGPMSKGGMVFSGNGEIIDWNPLTDDGDALQLAVKLGIDLEWRSDGRVAAYRHATANGHCFTAFESSREDPYAATRRAIVRAAAEIGRAMQ